MPFAVTPTNRVDIDMSGAGPDDFLVFMLEDRSQLYLRKRAGDYADLTFDEELLPTSLVDASRAGARKLLRHGMNSIYVNDRDKLRDMYESRGDRSLRLREFIALEIRREPYVSVVRPSHAALPGSINIGETLTLSFSRKVGDITFSTTGDDWVAPSPIKRIDPIDRFSALLREAQS